MPAVSVRCGERCWLTGRFEAIPDQFPVLRGSGFLLREVEAIDAPAWFVRGSDPEVAYPAVDELMTSVSQGAERVESVRAAFREKRRLRWAIVPDGESAAVGTTGFNVFSANDLRAELGYGLEKAWWGNGLMTAATRLCIGYAFEELGINRVEAHVLDDNERSLRVLEKLGFRREGLLREYEVVRGEARDFWVLGLLRSDVG